MWLSKIHQKSMFKSIVKQDYIQISMFMWMYDLPHLPYNNSTPMASCMNIWMDGMAFRKWIKANPNLSMWKANKQTNKWNRNSSYIQIHGGSKQRYNMWNKQNKHKLGFLDNDLHMHTEHACTRLFEIPNLENSKHRNKTELKIINLTT